MALSVELIGKVFEVVGHIARHLTFEFTGKPGTPGFSGATKG